MTVIRIKLDGFQQGRGILFGGFLLVIRARLDSRISFWPGVVIEAGGFGEIEEGSPEGELSWLPGTVLVFDYPGDLKGAKAFLEMMPEFSGLIEIHDDEVVEGPDAVETGKLMRRDWESWMEQEIEKEGKERTNDV